MVVACAGLEQPGAGLAPPDVLDAAGVGGPAGQRSAFNCRGERAAQLADRLLSVGHARAGSAPARRRRPQGWRRGPRFGADLGEDVFVVPMVPLTWNDRERVEEYVTLMGQGAVPTAVAISTLDVCEPAVGMSADHYQHWGLTHFLLDGHHKLEVAAGAGRSVRLLSLLALGEGPAGADDCVRQAIEPRHVTHVVRGGVRVGSCGRPRSSARRMRGAQVRCWPTAPSRNH